MTPVVFKIEDGEPLAVFPYEPGTDDPQTLTVYRHVGQHGSAAADYAYMLAKAKPEQWEPLERELRRRGYTDLKVLSRLPNFGEARRRRAEAIKQSRKG